MYFISENCVFKGAIQQFLSWVKCASENNPLTTSDYIWVWMNQTVFCKTICPCGGTTILRCKHLPDHVLEDQKYSGLVGCSGEGNSVAKEILGVLETNYFPGFFHNRIHRAFVMPRGCVILMGHAVCGVWSIWIFEPLYEYVNNSWQTSVLQNQFKKKHVT